MPGALLIGARREFYCPECGKESATEDPKVRTLGHVCPKLRFLSVPMVPKGTPAKVTIREREDYVGKEIVQLDPERNRPVMSIETTRDDGTDLVVLAPAARASTD